MRIDVRAHQRIWEISQVPIETVKATFGAAASVGKDQLLPVFPIEFRSYFRLAITRAAIAIQHDFVARSKHRRLKDHQAHGMIVGVYAAQPEPARKYLLLLPNLDPIADLLKVNDATVRNVLGHWGPGKFDAELLLDGKGFRPDGKTAATLIPPAFGLPGVNLHTWTGWGSITHWNAFVAVLEMHGKGTFFDPRLNDAAQFPVAAANGFGNVRNTPDLVTPKLGALHFYQLAIPAPKPPAESFDQEAAARGKELFEGQAKCATCHVAPPEPEKNQNKIYIKP